MCVCVCGEGGGGLCVSGCCYVSVIWEGRGRWAMVVVEETAGAVANGAPSRGENAKMFAHV